jgi:hypothetical protein
MRVIFDAAGCAEVRRIPVDYPVELGRFLKMRETRFEVSGGQVGLRRSGLKQIVTGEKELRFSLQLDPKRRETPKHEFTPSHRGGVGMQEGSTESRKETVEEKCRSW